MFTLWLYCVKVPSYELIYNLLGRYIFIYIFALSCFNLLCVVQTDSLPDLKLIKLVSVS